MLNKRRLEAWILGLLMSAWVGVSSAAWPAPGLSSTPLPSPECTDGAIVYYVAPGVTNGIGTFVDPFNNLQTALDSVEAGDTIYVLSGVYELGVRLLTREHGGDDARICIRAYEANDRPIFTRQTGFGGSLITVRHSRYVFDGLVFDGGFAPESESTLVNISHYANGAGTDDNADYAVIRNCEIKDNLRNGLVVSADHVLVENCHIHHNLRGSMASPRDAHGITGTHQTDLTIRRCDIHHNSGDGLQTDPDINNSAGQKLWDEVVIEHSRIWTGPLVQGGGTWYSGDDPGENAVDTKTFENEPLTHRPRISVRNVEAFGFVNTSNSRRSTFNIKYRVDWTLDGITVSDSEIAFRVRGPYDNPLQGGAHATILNAVAFDNDMVFRVERDVEQLRIHHGTFDGNALFASHADCPTNPCYDEGSFELDNSLFFDGLPAEAWHSSNFEGSGADVVDYLNNDYHLVLDSAAVDAGIELPAVTTDFDGHPRPLQIGWDVGADEFLGDLVFADGFEDGDMSAWR